MGNQKGYVPSEEARQKVSEALKRAYAEGRRKPRDYAKSEETKRKQSESLKLAYAEGRMVLTGAALQASLAPKKSEAERKARKLVTQRIWRANNPEVLARYKQKYTPEYYGLTNEQYEAQSRSQNDVCAICKMPQQNGYRLAIDHNHDCCPERRACDRCRRGLLCSNCNQAFGLVYESEEILQSMILYARQYKDVSS